MTTKKVANLAIAQTLHDFIGNEALPGLGIATDDFWEGLSALVADLAPRNKALLAKRDELQAQIDRWNEQHRGKPHDEAAYIAFLREIGYLQPEPDQVAVATGNVDPEIASIAGPQLVVPVTNARYALNAANARWGSLYDALYGTDAIPRDGGAPAGGGLDKGRAAKVVAKAREILDQAVPLAEGSWAGAAGFTVENGKLLVKREAGSATGLKDPAQFVGYQGDAAAPSVILLKHNGLHIEIHLNRRPSDRARRRGRRLGRRARSRANDDPGLRRFGRDRRCRR